MSRKMRMFCRLGMVIAVMSAFSGKAQAFVVDNPFDLAVTPPPGGYFEVPFWIVPGGARQLSVTTAWSYACWTSQNPLTQSIPLPASQCALVLKDYAHNGATPKDWRRNYNGIYSQHVINALGGNRLIAINNHGENKNECYGGQHTSCGGTAGCTAGTCFQNTVNTAIACGSCSDGYDSCGNYTSCWSAYNAFVNMSWQYYDAAHNWGMAEHNDQGPILWPANGYTYGGVKSSSGLRHPHGYTNGAYIYAFYLDTSNGGNGGYGIKIARALVSSGGLPTYWKTYCGGTWVPSLPVGFNRENMALSYPKRGGCSTAILPATSDQVSFAVAKNTQGGYIGVEERVSSNIWQLRLWRSGSLTNWTLLQTVRSISGGWGAGDLHYPVLLSADGWNNSLIDGNNFYIVGTRGVTLRAMLVHN